MYPLQNICLKNEDAFDHENFMHTASCQIDGYVDLLFGHVCRCPQSCNHLLLLLCRQSLISHDGRHPFFEFLLDREMRLELLLLDHLHAVPRFGLTLSQDGFLSICLTQIELVKLRRSERRCGLIVSSPVHRFSPGSRFVEVSFVVSRLDS